MAVLYKKLLEGGTDTQQIKEAILRLKMKDGKDKITLEDFEKFVRGFKQHHLPCGKDCMHLARFYLRLGFILMKYYSKKKALKMFKAEVVPFNWTNYWISIS